MEGRDALFSQSTKVVQLTLGLRDVCHGQGMRAKIKAGQGMAAYIIFFPIESQLTCLVGPRRDMKCPSARLEDNDLIL